ncbi:guanitoxin biosynthesis heme-dependent pre-guanitoxin N-hydroxylase GntA [Actinoplanes sp. N902-109]|uniref:guanitoxin biosynthesis heme-dependent pre-guanitoxin N-hydroxylase GntA n=1 Tax=Actinoplanes sp. (strain N902-109) TaxID=649831 RepID=UPI0003294D9E|nr:guanitoxin biosynthesis heme-dependent pre-guanitoxin N-hydroxylase GntA [Actinoplanes sp. N902-109]AGL14984.1 hypothetical protein L083_1474 [Actinoplanes sp. N902-109]
MSTGLDSAFRAWLESDTFTCLGARASLHRGELVTREYARMGDTADTQQLYADLAAFLAEGPRPGGFHSFAALFTEPGPVDEEGFEKVLWQQLGELHELDRDGFGWAPDASTDPEDPMFAFSLAGHPVFVIGLHPYSSRISRRFRAPALVFNSHRQFAELKEQGRWPRLQHAIRRRELLVQGSVNPMLSDYGEASEAPQYSGRAVPADWRCPFAL